MSERRMWDILKGNAMPHQVHRAVLEGSPLVINGPVIRQTRVGSLPTAQLLCSSTAREARDAT
jgi:hypothetical protein